ncbi:MAG: hypothetical protein C4335_10565 [Armatimonadota bacterium]
MRARFVTCVLAGAVLLASAPGHAQDAQAILNKVASAYKNAKTYQAQASINQTIQVGNQQQRQSGTIITKYKAPNKLVTIVQGMQQNLHIYSDGKTLYIYSPKENQYMKGAAPASFAQQQGIGAVGGGDPTQIGLQLQSMFGTGAKKLPDRKVGGKPAFVIQSSKSGSSPDGQGTFQMTATALIDKASYLLKQLTLNGTRTSGTQKVVQNVTIVFASQQINPNLPDSAFVFKPPAGAKELQRQGAPGAPSPR